jgi:hypothetical protein
MSLDSTRRHKIDTKISTVYSRKLLTHTKGTVKRPQETRGV